MDYIWNHLLNIKIIHTGKSARSYRILFRKIKKMRKLLKLAWIIQEKRTLKNRRVRRFNPWNPLSYLVAGLALTMGILMFGFIGIKDQIDSANPFKWQ